MKIFLIISLTLLASIIVGQDNPIVGNMTYLKVFRGSEASFEKNVAAHTAKYHGIGQWNVWGAKVVSGKRTGQYLIGSGSHYWRDYAERKTTKAHDDEWTKIIRAHVEETSGSIYYVKGIEVSYNDVGVYPMWSTNIYYTKPGGKQTMQSVLKKSAKVRAKTKSNFSRGIYYNVTGDAQDGLVYEVNRMSDMSDMVGESPALLDQWLKVHGQKDWDLMTKDWFGSFVKSETEIIQRISAMNSPQK